MSVRNGCAQIDSPHFLQPNQYEIPQMARIARASVRLGGDPVGAAAPPASESQSDSTLTAPC
jgi:hypothetical protein